MSRLRRQQLIDGLPFIDSIVYVSVSLWCQHDRPIHTEIPCIYWSMHRVLGILHEQKLTTLQSNYRGRNISLYWSCRINHWWDHTEDKVLKRQDKVCNVKVGSDISNLVASGSPVKLHFRVQGTWHRNVLFINVERCLTSLCILVLWQIGHLLDSITASIPVSHTGDPGSIPGRGMFTLRIIVLSIQLVLVQVQNFYLSYIRGWGEEMQWATQAYDRYFKLQSLCTGLIFLCLIGSGRM